MRQRLYLRWKWARVSSRVLSLRARRKLWLRWCVLSFARTQSIRIVALLFRNVASHNVYDKNASCILRPAFSTLQLIIRLKGASHNTPLSEWPIYQARLAEMHDSGFYVDSLRVVFGLVSFFVEKLKIAEYVSANMFGILFQLLSKREIALPFVSHVVAVFFYAFAN